MAMKLLNNLVNKNDVLSITIAVRNSSDNERVTRVVNGLYSAVNSMQPINVVEAGDINIVCEDVDSFVKYLDNHRSK